MTSYFPLFYHLQNTSILLIGAGEIGLFKLETLLQYSKNITIVSQDFHPLIEDLIQKHNLSKVKSTYQKAHLQDHDIIIGATNDSDINQQIHTDATALNKLINNVDNPAYSNFIFGAIVRRNNINIAISSSGISPVLSRLLKQKIETIIPQNIIELESLITANRQLVKDKLGNIQARRLFWQEVIEGTIAQELLVGNKAQAQKLLADKLESTSNTTSSAIYFIGTGPGDPDLLTIKAMNLISKADIILYDRLVSTQVLEYARKDAIKIYVGKTKDHHTCDQNQINDMLRKYATNGKIVARLKGGDPSIFAHLYEEIDAISDLNIHYQIIPGITAATSAAIDSGVSLTARGYAPGVRFITLHNKDHYDDQWWQELAQTNDTLVFYMSSMNATNICQSLIKFNKNPATGIAVIEQSSTPYQKTYKSTLEHFKDNFTGKKFISPTILIIGEVINHSQDWKETTEDGLYFNQTKCTPTYKESEIRDYIEQLNSKTKNLNWIERIKYIATQADVIFSTSFSIEDQVITHVIAENKLNVEMFTIDTGRLFNETYDCWQKTIEQYPDITIKAYYPEQDRLQNFINKNGINSFYQSQSLRKECCNIRKVVPLKKALKNKKIWISGIQASQSNNRADKDFFEYDQQLKIIKFYPILDMNSQENWGYIKKHNIAFNDLYDKGFTSIGCSPCTRATGENEDSRAGRWWWEEGKKECGIHFESGKIVKQ